MLILLPITLKQELNQNKMNEIKKRKKESQYLLWISKILNEEVTNANIASLTVTDVKLSNDGSHLKIFIIFSKNEKKSLEALNATKGFVRTQLSKYERGRKVPSLVFCVDDVFCSSNRIETILKQIKKEEVNDK